MDKEVRWDEIPRAPHCDARILHAPESCSICASATELQEERARLGVNNTGQTDRQWPCPAERARSLENMHKWFGNTPKIDAALGEVFDLMDEIGKSDNRSLDDE